MEISDSEYLAGNFQPPIYLFHLLQNSVTTTSQVSNLRKNEPNDVRLELWVELEVESLAADLRFWLEWLRVTVEVGGELRDCNDGSGGVALLRLLLVRGLSPSLVVLLLSEVKV